MLRRLIMKVILLYYTKTGHTLEAINAVAEGIKSAGSNAEVINVNDFKENMLSGYDAVIIGSPCWKGSVSNKAGIATPIKEILENLGEGALKGKKCGGVAVNCGKGGEVTIKNVGLILETKGCEEYKPGPVARAGTFLSLWKGPSVSEKDLGIYRTYGAGFLTHSHD
jgi:multimeric flavodoxin WrbA